MNSDHLERSTKDFQYEAYKFFETNINCILLMMQEDNVIAGKELIDNFFEGITKMAFTNGYMQGLEGDRE